jgi:hypothetical protein
MTPPDVLGGFSVFSSRCVLDREETHREQEKKVDPEFEPKMIEDDWDDRSHFFGCTPHQIEADWHEKWGPLLEGFPLNILFATIRNDAQTGQQSVVEVCYWPDLATFREDAERKEICYFTEPMSAYFVRVILEKKTGRWQTQKFKGETVIRSAFGSTFDGAMLHTTIDGPEPDEQ